MNQFLLLLALPFCASSVAQTIQWEHSFGGIGNEYTAKIIKTPDGGYLVGTNSESNDGDVSGNHGSLDFWLLKLNSDGEKQWQKCLGGLDIDGSVSIENATSGGYILLSNTASNGLKSSSQVFGNHGDLDFWVIKVNDIGDIEWRQCYGGCGSDEGRAIKQTSDGNYCVVGATYSYNSGDVYGSHSNGDAWVIKLSPTGELLWQKTIGGSGHDYLYDVLESDNGSLIIGGLTSSTDGDLTGNINKGLDDFWVAKLSDNGNLIWSKTYGGSDNDGVRGMCLATDGSIVVAGLAYSGNGDVTNAHGAGDMWVLHLNAAGNLLWQQSFGGSGLDIAFSVFQRSNDDFIVTGETGSFDGNVTGNHGGRDLWVVRFDKNGILKSQNCFGGSDWDYTRSAIPGDGDEIILGGASSSFDGDVSQNNGLSDTWIVKLSVPLGLKPESPDSKGYDVTITPNPASSVVWISTNISELQTVALFDASGKLMQTFEMNDIARSVDISNWPSGTYRVQISTWSGVFLSRAFVKK